MSDVQSQRRLLDERAVVLQPLQPSVHLTLAIAEGSLLETPPRGSRGTLPGRSRDNAKEEKLSC